MKNALLYYYSLESTDIHQNGKEFRFTVDHSSYLFLPYERNIDDIQSLYELSNQLLAQQIYCHQIMLNNNQQAITMIQNIPYVLLKLYVQKDQLVTLYDILLFSNYTIGISQNPLLIRNNWKQLWSEKNDYFEYQMNQFGKQFPKLRESFSYFLGMSENAIALLNLVTNEEQQLVVSHKRIKKGETYEQFYNPLTFVLDSRVRDISEYFKEQFFMDHHILNEIKSYFTYNRFTVQECLLFYARMYYPTFYFDRYEDIIYNHGSEQQLDLILDHVYDYEIFLKQLHFYLKSILPLPDIDWIIKV